MSCSKISSNRPEMALLGPDGVREASARGM